MTTIASDGVTVVADGRGVSGTTIVSEGREKLRRIGRKIYAFSGAYGLMDPVIYWERDGQEAAPALGEQEWELAVFEIGRVTYYCSAVPFPVLYGYPFALGTGADFAMGAMLAGASPERAVKIAASRDTHTGGMISTAYLDVEPIGTPEEFGRKVIDGVVT